MDKARQDQVGKYTFYKHSKAVRPYENGKIVPGWSGKAHQSSSLKGRHWNHQLCVGILSLPMPSWMNSRFFNSLSPRVLLYKVAMIIISTLVWNRMNTKHLTQGLPHSQTTPAHHLLLQKLGLDGKGRIRTSESAGKGEGNNKLEQSNEDGTFKLTGKEVHKTEWRDRIGHMGLI